MTDLTIQKLENMLGAHTDHVYRLSARGEDFTYGVTEQLLSALKREVKLRDFLQNLVDEELWVFQNYLKDKYPHSGDCTKECHSCILCCIQQTIDEAKEALQVRCEYSGAKVKDD